MTDRQAKPSGKTRRKLRDEVQWTAAESMDGVLKDLRQPAKKQRQKRAS